MVVVLYVYFSVEEYCVYHVPNIIAYWITEQFIKALVYITWPPANQIAWNVLPAGALNRIKHTLLYVKFLNAHLVASQQRQSGTGMRSRVKHWNT